jgi:hypothetical protein
VQVEVQYNRNGKNQVKVFYGTGRNAPVQHF